MPSSIASRKRARAEEISLLVVSGGASQRGDRRGGEREPDRLGTHGQQTGDVVRLPRVVDVGDERASGPQSRACERDVHRPDREHGRDGRPVGTRSEVAHHQDRLAVGHRRHRLGAEPSERDPEAGRSAMHAPGRVQPPSGRPFPLEEALELLERGGGRVVAQQRRPRAEQDAERHHRPLAEMIHGGVRHLCEPLSQMVEDRAAVTTENGDRRVVAHRERGLLPVRGRRPEHHREVFPRVAVQDLPRQELVVAHRLGAGHLGQARDAVRIGPRRPRFPIRDRTDRVVVEAAFPRIDDDHLTGTELPAPDPSAGQVDHPGLRRTDDEPVVGHPVAQRPEPVAVERRADRHAVGEDQRRRAVPRLHQRRVPPVERSPLLVHVGGLFPRGGDEHGDRAADVSAFPMPPTLLGEELDGLVQDGRVGTPVVDHGPEERLLGRRGESQPAFARLHAVRVAGDGVDLAVVTEHPERLRAFPRGRRVRGVALMEDDERRVEIGIEEVEIERPQPIGRRERLVRDGREAARHDVDVPVGRTSERIDPPTHSVRALLRAGGHIGRRRAQHRLQDARPGGAGVFAER